MVLYICMCCLFSFSEDLDPSHSKFASTLFFFFFFFFFLFFFLSFFLFIFLHFLYFYFSHSLLRQQRIDLPLLFNQLTNSFLLLFSFYRSLPSPPSPSSPLSSPPPYSFSSPQGISTPLSLPLPPSHPLPSETREGLMCGLYLLHTLSLSSSSSSSLSLNLFRSFVPPHLSSSPSVLFSFQVIKIFTIRSQKNTYLPLSLSLSLSLFHFPFQVIEAFSSKNIRKFHRLFDSAPLLQVGEERERREERREGEGYFDFISVD